MEKTLTVEMSAKNTNVIGEYRINFGFSESESDQNFGIIIQPVGGRRILLPMNHREASSLALSMMETLTEHKDKK